MMPSQTPASVRLEPIREPEYGAWLAQSMAEYAEEKVEAGNYHPDEALQCLPNRSIASCCRRGRKRPASTFLVSFDASTGDKVGVVWFAERPRWPWLEAFIFDLVVLEPFRRRGYAGQR